VVNPNQETIWRIVSTSETPITVYSKSENCKTLSIQFCSYRPKRSGLCSCTCDG
jgi:hypothetical protein